MARWAPLLLAAGALGVVLAHVESQVFDLERFQAPKALALHVTALALLLTGAVRRPSRGGAVVGLALAFVAWSALSAAFATNPWLGLGSWGISFSAAVVLVGAGGMSDERRNLVLAWILGAVVLGAAVGVAQAYGWRTPWLASSRPPGGTFGNRNFLAHLAAIGAPALLTTLVEARRRGGRWAAVLGLTVVTLAVVLTRSRAAWLGGAAGILVTGVALALGPGGRRAPSGTRRLGVGALALAASVGAAVVVPNALAWNTDSPYVGTLTRLADFREGSGRGRMIQYRTSLELAAESPVLGVGPGNWFVHYPRVTDPGDPSFGGHLTIPTNPWPSSDWVALLTERGAPALLLLLAAGGIAWLASLRRAWGREAVGRVREATPGERRPGPPVPVAGLAAAGAHTGGAALAGILTATAVTGLFDAVLLLPAPALVVAALAGTLLPWRPPLPTPVRGGRWVRAGLLLVAAALVTHAALTTASVALTAIGRETSTLARASRLAPWDHRLRLLLAERGRCADAHAAVRLLPFHARARELAEGCRR